MPFNPNLPIDDSLATAAELRDQLNALNDKIDAQAAQIADLTSQVNDLTNACAQFVTAGDVDHAILSGSAGNCDPVDSLNLAVSSPPSQTDVQTIANKQDEVIRFLQRA